MLLQMDVVNVIIHAFRVMLEVLIIVYHADKKPLEYFSQI